MLCLLDSLKKIKLAQVFPFIWLRQKIQKKLKHLKITIKYFSRSLLVALHSSNRGNRSIPPKKKIITRLNCALDRRTILFLYVPGFQRKVFKHVKILSERSKEMKKQKKNKESVLVAEYRAYNSQNAQFGLVRKKFFKINKARIFNHLRYQGWQEKISAV